jgi:hypothetical protein
MLIYVLASPMETSSDLSDKIKSRKLLKSNGVSENSNFPLPLPLYSFQGRIQFNNLTFHQKVTSMQGDIILFDLSTLEGFDSSEIIQLRINVTYPATTGSILYGGISYVNSSLPVGVRESLYSTYGEVGGQIPYIYPKFYGNKDEIQRSVVRGKGMIISGTQGDLNEVLLALQISPPEAFTGLFNIELDILYPLLSNSSYRNLAMNLYVLPSVEAPIAVINYLGSDPGGSPPLSKFNYCNISASSLLQISIFHTDLNCYKSLYSITFSSNISSPSHYFTIYDHSIEKNTNTSSDEFLISTSTDGGNSDISITGKISLDFRVCYPAGVKGGDVLNVGAVVKYLGCPNIDGNIVSVSNNATIVFMPVYTSVSPTISFNATHKLCEEDQPCDLPTFSITSPPIYRETDSGSNYVVVANLSLLHGMLLFSSPSSNMVSSLGLSIERYSNGRIIVVKGNNASIVQLYINTLYYQPDLNFNGVWHESDLKEKIILNPSTELEILTVRAFQYLLDGNTSPEEYDISTQLLKISVSWNNDAPTISFPSSSTMTLSNTSGDLFTGYSVYALNITEDPLIFSDIFVGDVDLNDVVKKTYNETYFVEAIVQCDLIDGGLISMPLISLVKSGRFST